MKTHQFAVLDGLRGIAALVVLSFHIVQQRSLQALPYAGLAVDFFYVLSGFVVAYAYEAKLRDGQMSLAGFARVRFNRLYPLLFVGTAIGVALAVVATFTKHTVTIAQVGEAAILAFLLLPSFVFPQWATAYPFNMAAWSLTFEAFINGVYAVIAPRLTRPRLLALVCISAAVLIWAMGADGIHGGNNQVGFAAGFSRVFYPFFVGVLLFHVRPRASDRPLLATALMVALPILLLGGWGYYPISSLLFVLVLCPAFVGAGAACMVEGRLSSFCRITGDLSYPVYILQGPILRLGEEALKKTSFGNGGFAIFAMIEGLGVIALSWLALKFIDEPVRRWLGQKSRPAVASITETATP